MQGQNKNFDRKCKVELAVGLFPELLEAGVKAGRGEVGGVVGEGKDGLTPVAILAAAIAGAPAPLAA